MSEYAVNAPDAPCEREDVHESHYWTDVDDVVVRCPGLRDLT